MYLEEKRISARRGRPLAHVSGSAKTTRDVVPNTSEAVILHELDAPLVARTVVVRLAWKKDRCAIFCENLMLHAHS